MLRIEGRIIVKPSGAEGDADVGLELGVDEAMRPAAAWQAICENAERRREHRDAGDQHTHGHLPSLRPLRPTGARIGARHRPLA
jgi:hypothetical protein